MIQKQLSLLLLAWHTLVWSLRVEGKLNKVCKKDYIVKMKFWGTFSFFWSKLVEESLADLLHSKYSLKNFNIVSSLNAKIWPFKILSRCVWKTPFCKSGGICSTIKLHAHDYTLHLFQIYYNKGLVI